MLSATDPLFTLHTNHDNTTTTTAATARPPSNGSAVTAVCFVRDPIGTNHHGGGVSGGRDRCGPNNSDDDDNNNFNDENDDSESDDSASSSSSETGPLHFRCTNILLGKRDTNNHDAASSITQPRIQDGAAHLSAASHTSLSGGILASCHMDGTAKLWDLSTRRCIVSDFCHEARRQQRQRGAGLALRRFTTGKHYYYESEFHETEEAEEDATHRFLYQTRDPLGTVTLHDLNRPEVPIVEMYTHSTSFCTMAPCHVGRGNNCSDHVSTGVLMGGANNLVALPTELQSTAVVRDLRCDPKKSPAWSVTVGETYRGWREHTSSGNGNDYHGMLMSLALCMQESTERIVLGCGMEDGSVFFHDLGAVGCGRKPWWINPEQNTSSEGDDSLKRMNGLQSKFMCQTKLGKEPVLCLDLVSSSHSKAESSISKASSSKASLVAVSGCAGDADEMEKLPSQEQGTISTIRVSLAEEGEDDDDNQSATINNNHHHRGTNMKAKIRTRTPTCSLTSGGKIGVSTCRFRPDGRIFAVGGWDHRLRIFGRSTSKPLAILCGHEESVTAVDWAENAGISGLLATGAGDGKICVYRVFPHSLRGV